MITLLLLKIAGFAAYQGLEYWLGKTEKTKSGSVAELVITTGLGILKQFSIIK